MKTCAIAEDPYKVIPAVEKKFAFQIWLDSFVRFTCFRAIQKVLCLFFC
jgi:hypothetical protein